MRNRGKQDKQRIKPEIYANICFVREPTTTQTQRTGRRPSSPLCQQSRTKGIMSFQDVGRPGAGPPHRRSPQRPSTGTSSSSPRGVGVGGGGGGGDGRKHPSTPSSSSGAFSSAAAAAGGGVGVVGGPGRRSAIDGGGGGGGTTGGQVGCEQVSDSILQYQVRGWRWGGGRGTMTPFFGGGQNARGRRGDDGPTRAPS